MAARAVGATGRDELPPGPSNPRGGPSDPPVSHALALLGEDNLRRWISVVCFAVMAGSKPQELVRTSLIRARFAESLAVRAKLGKRAGELFLLGLLSLMDALLDRPMEKLLHEIPVHPEVADALRGQDSVFFQVLETVRNYERGDWEAWQAAVHRLSLAESDIPPMFLESVEWADQALHACRVP